ncbi:hypothetical protein DPMN_070181 [Dreissena polymorpha]|uniref:C2H2-type domain-containing protein n=1 Tax=Dreissena polymorpha TaxID=45954 RepID=A0A9D4BVG6_DREPO|nr:hypothetical protein DPMN_070181 [Dreissena polymorpha]
MIDHIYKHHVALDDCPFYCTLCMFRCTTKEALQKHVTNYTKHTALAGNNNDQTPIQSLFQKERTSGRRPNMRRTIE